MAIKSIAQEMTHAERCRQMDARLRSIQNALDGCYEIFAESDPNILLGLLRNLFYKVSDTFRYQRDTVCNSPADLNESAQADQPDAEIVELWMKEQADQVKPPRHNEDAYATGVDGYATAPQ